MSVLIDKIYIVHKLEGEIQVYSENTLSKRSKSCFLKAPLKNIGHNLITSYKRIEKLREIFRSARISLYLTRAQFVGGSVFFWLAGCFKTF